MTVTYVRKQIPTIQDDFGSLNYPTKEHVITHFTYRGQKISIINAYWTPRDHDSPLPPLQTPVVAAKAPSTLLLLGDFNCPHPNWGYDRTSALGRKLDAFAGLHHLTLLNDTSTPTRQGTARENDTTPDLTWIRSDMSASWDNTDENLGSDHHIIQITLTPKHGTRQRHSRSPISQIVDWPKARKAIEDLPASNPDPTAWCANIMNTVAKYTRHVKRTEEHPYIDTHLLNIWSKRRRVV